MWSSIPVSGPPFRSLKKLDHFPPESVDQLRRNPHRWVGENYNAPWPIALYGLMLLFAGIAYFILTKALIAHHGASGPEA